MMSNVPSWKASDWKYNIKLAADAHINAFALNMAHGWYANENTLALAFKVAEQENFQLFFSFDYAGNGSWPQEDVIRLIKQYSSSSAYFQHNGGPFVSTFEGPNNAGDWANIKAQTGCFFVPDWSSLGAIPAAAAADGVVDGLFNWATWP
ncbi:hypothetical protein BBP40_003262 [Aspergillus hancockii]|nr:hypothetical protein BBP40_003262 [Aspergillus hancockii]